MSVEGWVAFKASRTCYTFGFQNMVIPPRDSWSKKTISWCCSLTLLAFRTFLLCKGRGHVWVHHNISNTAFPSERKTYLVEIASPAIWGHFLLFVLWFNSKTMHLVVLTKKLFFIFWLFPFVVITFYVPFYTPVPYYLSVPMRTGSHWMTNCHSSIKHTILPKTWRILKIVLTWLR